MRIFSTANANAPTSSIISMACGLLIAMNGEIYTWWNWLCIALAMREEIMFGLKSVLGEEGVSNSAKDCLAEVTKRNKNTTRNIQNVIEGMENYWISLKEAAALLDLAGRLPPIAYRHRPSFHSGESRNLCGEAAFAEGDHCNVPLRGKFSLSRE